MIIMKERTLILIKPDAISKRLTGIIIDRIERLGLDMKAAKVTEVTDSLAREHYLNLAGKPFLDNVVSFMRGNFNGITDHRIYAFVYEGEDAIEKIRTAIGATDPSKAEPSTIRGAFGAVKNGVMQNCVHASGSKEDAQREINLWFKPEEVLK
jgi:nucleoside-diphosphate kinase